MGWISCCERVAAANDHCSGFLCWVLSYYSRTPLVPGPNCPEPSWGPFAPPSGSVVSFPVHPKLQPTDQPGPPRRHRSHSHSHSK